MYTLITTKFSIKCLINHIFFKCYISREFTELNIIEKYGHQWRHLGKKRESVENILKTMHFFIFFATFKQVRQTILTWNLKLKLICIILTFYVIYVPTEDFKRAKTWGKLPSQTSYLNIFFLLLLIKACRILKNMAQIIHEDDHVLFHKLNKK